MDLLVRILNIIGSLGLLFWGMRLLSSTLQRVWGASVARRMVAASTPSRQILSTAGATAVVQSSGTITVTLVGLVNAGIVTLRQAIGMTLGANIGTTVTGWIVALFGFALYVQAISLPLIGLGCALILIHRRHYRSLGEMLIGFALMLFSLNLLQASLTTLGQHTYLPEYLALYGQVGYGSILLFCLGGTLLTALIRSSSTTVALTMVLCAIGWVSIEAAAATVLGCNIGTTLAANLAAAEASTNAKRVALSHTLVNLFGLLWAFPLLPWVAPGLASLFESLGEATSAVLGLALFHTLFNTINALLLSGFIPQLVRITSRLVRHQGSDNHKRLLSFKESLIPTPELSLLQARNELSNHIRRMVKMFGMARGLMTVATAEELQREYNHVVKYEKITRRVSHEITTYLAHIASGDTTEAAARRMANLFRGIAHVEQIAHSNLALATALLRKKEESLWLNQELREQLGVLFGAVEQALYTAAMTLDRPPAATPDQVIVVQRQVNTLSAALRAEQAQVTDGQKYAVGLAVVEWTIECDRLASAAASIAAEAHNL